MQLDLAITGGTLVTAADMFAADLGIKDGRIALLGAPGTLGGAARSIDAQGMLVMPGGVDSHCHIEQLEPDGGVNEEGFESASRACLAGGTTSVITFSNQFKGHRIRDTLEEYKARARRGAMVDYSFHQIVTDPTEAVLAEDIPALIGEGIRSLKVFLTYDTSHVDDAQYLRVLAAARRGGALVTVHCENYEAIRWRSAALLADGRTAPKYHAWSRPRVVEREATHRAIALAELVDQPIQIFHVSCSEVAEEIARAQARGVKVWAETCPQYLTLTAADMDRPGFEGAKFMCSPSPRDPADRDALWQDLRRGTLDIISSDHAGSSYDGDRGKAAHGRDAPFTQVPNGVPGLAFRLPLVFSEGVSSGRIDPCRFVQLVSANPAKLFGLYPRKGTIAPGADADLVLWDPSRRVTLTQALAQHAIDYTPYEGRVVTGWPVMTLRAGQVVMERDVVTAEPGSGRFLARAPYPMIAPSGRLADGFDASAFPV
ncbi:MAG: dihydropyrimidinase [Rhodospirillales bacterium]|nr:dihydropyrimidinase [Rhodospirillales bacterium]